MSEPSYLNSCEFCSKPMYGPVTYCPYCGGKIEAAQTMKPTEKPQEPKSVRKEIGIVASTGGVSSELPPEPPVLPPLKKPLIYVQKKVAEALDRVKTLAEHFALGEEARKALKKKSAATGNDAVEVFHGMKDKDKLEIRTDEIKSSETDVYESEVLRSHGPKRMLNLKFFNSDRLKSKFSLALHKERPHEEPPPLGKWWVALGGQENGPHDEKGLRDLVVRGKMTTATKVWKKGMSGWLPANQVEELASLFGEPPAFHDEMLDVD